MSEISRRTVLKALGLATASVVAGGAAVAVGSQPKSESPQVQITSPQAQPEVAPAAITNDLFPFEGIHQAGVITDPPEAVLLVALDVLATTPTGLVKVMQTLTARSRELMSGQLGAATAEDENFPPHNTGELGYDLLKEGHLSVMVGLGADVAPLLWSIRRRVGQVYLSRKVMLHYNAGAYEAEPSEGPGDQAVGVFRESMFTKNRNRSRCKPDEGEGPVSGRRSGLLSLPANYEAEQTCHDCPEHEQKLEVEFHLCYPFQ